LRFGNGQNGYLDIEPITKKPKELASGYIKERKEKEEADLKMTSLKMLFSPEA